MAKYFNYFPKTFYTSTSNNTNSSVDTVTNIMTRVSFESKLKENSASYYEYEIKDSDTPEIIAGKFYDNVNRHWIVLMFNDIIDPQWDWPLKYQDFIDYVDKKYTANGAAELPTQTGLAWAQDATNIHSYYKVVTQTNSKNEETIKKYQISSDIYANTAATSTSYTLQDGTTITEAISKETKTYYQFEDGENEAKRKIKLLNPSFIEQIEKEFKAVLK